ncbi:GNAT family N-acetyltransferase [Pseudoduganella sp. DS3]|uniref:GNAT family N-acetyltransferase n=1 Tax=Pseudoduganella guangdongensis TaxID=2692179 RepID=A0A6N9HLS5_9BURK|nr:GNAT family N-acetyltransferase [Pseudoduganella guangdongensis]MYN04316.1 GNAT family N-acetyltransferase [Pseudoduganella guangdongensis]
MEIQLRAVTRQNFDAITDLQLLDHQRSYIASNSYSIAQASFYPQMQTRAIYAGEELVGFLMYVDLELEGHLNEFGVWRLMIDSRRQGQGYGRAALLLALAEIRARGGVRKIWISYLPDNALARELYASIGFVETEIDEDGEMNAILEL